eukprot:6195078-Pleurochrysis_carterae.AAC.2
MPGRLHASLAYGRAGTRLAACARARDCGDSERLRSVHLRSVQWRRRRWAPLWVIGRAHEYARA